MAALLLISGCALPHKRSPYHDILQLVRVVKVAPSGEEPILYTDFLALRSESETLESVAAYVFRGRALSDGSASERVHSAMVSADFFQTLGSSPILGRALLPEENQPGRGQVAVISDDLWKRRFGADPNLIGRTITLDQRRHTVVGVMPADFQFPKKCDMWTPLASGESMRLEDESLILEVFARKKSSVTLQQAQDEMSDIARKLERDYPQTNKGRDVRLTSLFQIVLKEH
jgi:hypothetical protein